MRRTVKPPRVRATRPPADGCGIYGAGRMQRTLAATVAASGLPLGFEMYLEHYKGSFGDIWMWSPIVTSPLVSAAGLAAMGSRAAARTVLPGMAALYAPTD